MKRQQIRKGWILLVLLLAGMIPSARGGAGEISRRLLQVPEAVWEAVSAAFNRGDKQVQLDVLLETPQELDELKRMLRQMDGQVTDADGTYIQIQLPPSKVAAAVQQIPAVGVGVDQTYAVSETADDQVQPVPTSNLDESLRPSLEAMGAPVFQQQQQVTGQGIKIAVIDTGIDAGHLALQTGPTGGRKIIDFKDFTPEGKVFTAPITVAESYQASNGRRYTLPQLPVGSRPKFGLWSEWGVSGKINRDLDRSGSQIDKFGVLVVDSMGDGRYDQVWVDGNNSGSFRDDGGPLTLFRQDGKVGQLGRFRLRTSFVVADLDPAGDYVSFGFDGHGHGTAVSGVLAGWTPEGYQGAAPGAQIIALKAARSDGTAAWAEIRQAVQYAVQQGAQIINISIEGLATGTQNDAAVQGLWLRQISRQYGVLIVVAAGNGGPGLSSGATIGSPSEVLSVGSYYSPAMWKRDFNMVVPLEGLHWSSATGPRQDGAYVPSLVAPGGAPAPAPLWLQTNPYKTESGTSIAAPYASGAAALLLEASLKQGMSVTPDRMIRAMEGSARSLSGYDPFEQGYGLLQISAAFAALATAPAHPPLLVTSSTGGEGLLSRGEVQAGAQILLTNQGDAVERWSVKAQRDWVRSALTSVTLPQGVERRLDLLLSPPILPGVYTSFLQFQRPGEASPAFAVPVTYVQPYRFPTGTNRLQWSGTTTVARSQRQFVQVEPGLASLQFQARLGQDAQASSGGSMQVRIYRPDGRIAYDSGILGGPEGVGLVGQFQADHPVAGVWEVVVTAIPDKVGAYDKVGWSIDARAENGPIRIDQVRWNLAPGRTTVEMNVTNAYAPAFVRLEGIGLSRTNLDQPWRSETHLNQIDVFDLPQRAGAVRVEVANPYPANTDLDIKLWRDGTEFPVGESLTRGSSTEVIELFDLPAGRYRVTVGADGSDPPTLFYQYRRLVALQEYGMEVTDSAQRRLRGERWNVPVTFYTTVQPGRYVGHLMVRDIQSPKSLNWTTVEVSVGQPQLQVEPLVVPLVRGRSGQVVLELRNEKGALVNGTIIVNGRRYDSRAGQVMVPVTPSGTSLTLVVEADLKEYQYLRQEVRLPVSDSLQNWSIGTAPNQENNAWWRKYQSELP